MIAIVENMIVAEEVGEEVFSFCISRLTKFLRMSCPRSLQIQSALQSLGFQARRCYTYSDLIKTNAPFQAIYDVFKQFKKSINGEDHYFRHLTINDPAYKVLSKEIEFIPDFTFKAKETKIPIFFPNPEKNWGPKRKAATRKIVNQQPEQPEQPDDNQEKKVKIDNN